MFFFFPDTSTTEIYTLSLHDALPIFGQPAQLGRVGGQLLGAHGGAAPRGRRHRARRGRSEEHTSELQSHHDLVCRLLLEKKKKKKNKKTPTKQKTNKPASANDHM